MSRMLHALRQIEAKQPAPSVKEPISSPPIEESAESDSILIEETPIMESAESDSLSVDETPIVEFAAPDSFTIDKTPVVESSESDFSSPMIDKTMEQAEAAVASVLSPDEPDIYEDITQYILAQLTPGRHAALLFTSPDDAVEKSDTLFSLSKTLADHFGPEVLLLDALTDKTRMRNEKLPNNSGDWGYLLEQLKTRYQLVLIDAPSLANVQTAAMLPQCDGVYLTIRLGYATPYQVRQSLRVIQQSGGRLLGSIAIG